MGWGEPHTPVHPHAIRVNANHPTGEVWLPAQSDPVLYDPVVRVLSDAIEQVDAFYSEHGPKPPDSFELGDLLDDCIRQLEALQTRWLNDRG